MTFRPVFVLSTVLLMMTSISSGQERPILWPPPSADHLPAKAPEEEVVATPSQSPAVPPPPSWLKSRAVEYFTANALTSVDRVVWYPANCPVPTDCRTAEGDLYRGAVVASGSADGLGRALGIAGAGYLLSERMRRNNKRVVRILWPAPAIAATAANIARGRVGVNVIGVWGIFSGRKK